MQTLTKPVSPLKRGFKTQAENHATEYRTLLGLKPYSPMSALSLAQHLGIKVLTPNEIPGVTDDIIKELVQGQGKDRWSAAIYLKNDKKYIIHNPTHSIYRQESNLMHELAHAICEHELQDLETAVMSFILPLRKYNEEQEAEAECLGACLHLPQKALFHYHHILNYSREEISQTFTASKEMVNYRMSITAVEKIKFKKR